MARNPLAPFRSGGSPFGGDPFMTRHREMNRLFDELYRGDPQAAGASTGSLLETSMNVSETDSEFRITAELPGVAEDDIDIRLQDDVLTIRAEKKFERTEGGEKEDYHFVERAYGTFQRALRLPAHVDTERVSASCENGVLTIALPKSREQERSRRIELRGGKGKTREGRTEPGAKSEKKGG